MAELDTNKIDGLWVILDEPGSLFSSSDESYRMLLAALDLGWQVEEPVYLRPRWNESSRWVFHFILKQKPMDPPRLLTTSQSPDIERLVTEEGWRVDRFPVKENSIYKENRYANYRSQ